MVFPHQWLLLRSCLQTKAENVEGQYDFCTRFNNCTYYNLKRKTFLGFFYLQFSAEYIGGAASGSHCATCAVMQERDSRAEQLRERLVRKECAIIQPFYSRSPL